MKGKKLIFSVYDEAKEYIATESIFANKETIEKALNNIFSPGPSFQCIFDFSQRQFDFVSKSCSSILGYEMKELSVEKLIESIHPEDIGSVVRFQELAGKFLFERLTKTERPFYKITYQYRIADSQGRYKLFLHQGIILTMDGNGSISKTLLNVSDISSIQEFRSQHMSFIDIRSIQSFTHVSSEEDFLHPLPVQIMASEREKEILKLIAEGLSSKEIAKKLFISYDTVRTHRNNILQKNNLKTIPQAIASFIKEGLI